MIAMTNQPDVRPAYLAPVDDVIATLETDLARGLSADEARRRLETYGPNELPHELPVPA